MTLQEQNKNTVLRFNKEFLEQANLESFHQLVAPDFINRTAPTGTPNDTPGLIKFMEMFNKSFSDITVSIEHQIAEDDFVTTRKVIHATHIGEVMGIAATGKKVAINVIDIVRLRDGKYVELWGIRDMLSVVNYLKQA
jgi:predicted ester cyclase